MWGLWPHNCRNFGSARRSTHLFAVTTDGRHAAFWVDGARYGEIRPHNRTASWWTGPAGAATELLRGQDDVAAASLVELAADHRGNLTDEQYFSDSQRLLETAYLAAPTSPGGSGFGGNLDLSPAVVALARRRLPRWADRIWVGNALTRPPTRNGRITGSPNAWIVT